MNNKLKPRFNRYYGYIYPLFYYIHFVINKLSPLTIIQFIFRKIGKCWGYSRLFVDIYVSLWVVLVGALFSQLITYSTSPIPCYLMVIILILYGWRFIDIFQAWMDIIIKEERQHLPPRTILLAIVNYIELAVIFGAVGFLLKLEGYYNENAGAIQAVDGLRYSFGVITPLGVFTQPGTWSGGWLFYIEYCVGLLFLVVILNRVLAYLRN